MRRARDFGRTPSPPRNGGFSLVELLAIDRGRGMENVERCLADFAAWLGKKGHTADKPNAAFLGFARKWTTS